MSDTARTQRIEASISPDALAMVERAAEIEGCSVSDFIVDSAQAVAKQVIQENEVIKLSPEGQKRLVEAVLNPLEPTAALERAVANYNKMTRHN
jgi:uncharacterized protein (DUF1778 family)